MTSPEPSDDALRAALAPLDRRAFLCLAGVAGVGLAVGGGLAGCAPPREWAPSPDLGLGVLSPCGYATLNAAAARLLGPSAAVLIGTRRADPAARADAWLQRTPELGATLGQGLAVLEFAPWPLLPKGRPFTALSEQDRDAVLRSCMVSRLDLKRDLFRGIKSIAALAFYGDPISHRGVGFPGAFGSAEEISAAMTYPVEAGGPP